MDKIEFIIVFIYIIILLFFIQSKFFDDKKWIIEKNNNKYILRNELDNYNDLLLKADILETLIHNIELLIYHLNNKYRDTETHYWLKYLNEFDVRDISEAKWKENTTSYTLDKKHIFLCMQSPVSKKIHSLNTLTYVLIHELAHFCNIDRKGNPIFGHGSEFIYLNALLLKEATNIGIYNYINYSKHNEEYCGITLYSSVLG